MLKEMLNVGLKMFKGVLIIYVERAVKCVTMLKGALKFMLKGWLNVFDNVESNVNFLC